MTSMPRRTTAPRALFGLGTWFLVACLAVAASPLLLVRPISDPSPWLHLRVGDYLRTGGRFGLPDPWAPFAQHAYEPTQWLPSMAMSKAVDQFGPAALTWSRGMGVILLGLVLYAACRPRANAPASLAVTALGMGAAWPTLTERPQLLGFVLLVPSISLWQQSARDGQVRWLLVALTWLLACTHGIWSLGLAVGAACVAGSRHRGRARRQLVLCWLGSAAAAAATPLGPRLLLTPFAAGSNGRQFVEEWMPSSVRTPNVMCALLMAALLVGLWLWRSHRPAPWELLLVLLAVGLTLAMRRTVPVAAFVLAPMLAAAGSGLERLPAPDGGHDSRSAVRRELAALSAAGLVAALVAVPLAAAAGRKPPADVPSGVTTSLRALPDGTRIVATGDVTGWILHATPNLRLIFDLRIESYNPEHVKAFIDAMDAKPGWDDFVTRTGATAAVLLESSPLAVALEEQDDWRTVARDGTYILLERR